MTPHSIHTPWFSAAKHRLVREGTYDWCWHGRVIRAEFKNGNWRIHGHLLPIGRATWRGLNKTA